MNNEIWKESIWFYKNELEIKNIVCKVVMTKLLQNMYRNRKEKLT